MGFFFLLVIIVGSVIAIAVQRAREELNRSWKTVAERLKLTQVAADWATQPKLQGTVSGYPVTVDIQRKGSGKNHNAWTRFRLGVPTQPGISVREEGFLSAISKAFGTGDIEIGQQAFDDRFNVKGKDADAVRAYLTPKRRAGIQRFFTTHAGTELDGQGITWSRKGKLRDPSQMLAIIDDMLAFGRELDAEAPPVAAESMPAVDAEFSDGPEPETTEPEPGAEAMSEPEPEYSPQPLAAVDGAVDLREFCDTVFAPGSLSFQASQAFDSRYKGQQAAWSGILQSIEPYSFDFTFGSGKGLKATFVIHKVDGGLLGNGEVKAVLQLPADAAGLDTRIGERVSFSGKLTKVDGLMRKVFLANGHTQS